MKLRSAMLILLALLLLIVTGCKQQDPSLTTSPTTTNAPTTTTPTTTEAPNAGLILYQAAVQELSQRKDVMLSVTVQETASFPAEERKEATTQTAIYLGLGTDDFKAVVRDKTAIGTNQVSFTETYAAGKVYLTSYEGFNYMSDQTADQYLARKLPIVLINAEKYTTCTSEETMGKTAVTFSDCLAFEEWAGHESGSLLSAEGTALIGPDGKINRYTYDLRYSLLGVKIHQQITVDIFTPIGETIEAPAQTDHYVSIPDLDMIPLVYRATLRSLHTSSLSYQSYAEVYSQISNEGLGLTEEIQRYGTDRDTMVSFYNSVRYDGETQEVWEMDELFRDGVFSYSENGGPTYKDTSISLGLVEDTIENDISELMFGPEFLTDIQIIDLGNVYMVTGIGNEEIGKEMEDLVTTSLYGDVDAIDRHASAYRTERLEFYLAIDKYFGFYTALGYYFEGVHTVDGYEYTLIADNNASITIASQESYNAITEEAMPAESEQSPSPLFYHVTGQNGEEMWLLGTIHVGDARTGNLPKEILDAFEASDALALECDTRKMEEEMQNPMLSSAYAAALYYLNGTTAEDHISDSELYKLASLIMQASGNKNSYTNMYKVSMWENTISNFTHRLTYSLSSDMGVDNRLTRMAEASGKEILQVESNLSQIIMLGGWSDPLAEVLLAESVSTNAAAYHQSLTELYELWCNGDEEAIAKELFTDTEGMTDEEKALWEEYNSKMSTERNKKMAEVAIKYLQVLPM